jgi:hypothetical protein
MAQNMLQKLIQVVAITVLLTGTAFAQVLPLFKGGVDKPPPTQEEVEKQQATDKAYKSATQKIPDKKVADPWATVRPDPAPAPKNNPATASKNNPATASKNKQ